MTVTTTDADFLQLQQVKSAETDATSDSGQYLTMFLSQTETQFTQKKMQQLF